MHSVKSCLFFCLIAVAALVFAGGCRTPGDTVPGNTNRKVAPPGDAAVSADLPEDMSVLLSEMGWKIRSAESPADGLQDAVPPDPAAVSLPVSVAASREPIILPGLLSGKTPPLSGPQPVSVPLPEVDQVERLLARMTLSERIGQRFIIWIRSRSELPYVKNLIMKGRPAGILVYPKNFRTYEDLRSLIAELNAAAAQSRPGLDLFICADQEGGRVSAFHYPETILFPAPWYWSLYDDPSFIASSAYLLGKEMKKLGFNMNFAPVLDVYGKPDSSIVGDRSMGSDPDRAAVFARAYMDGISASGVLPVAKHFPGHGVTETDTHEKLPVSEKTEAQLLSRDIVPFKSAIEYGLQAVMTAHILFPKIDRENPATFSPAIVDGLLRKKLGYGGIVMTDALEMGAISKNFSIDDTLVRLIRAGVDIALVAGTYDLLELERLLEAAVKTGRLSEQQVNEGARRVLRLKRDAGLLTVQPE